MVKKLEIDHNEKGEIVSPSYVDIVSKINEIIDVISIKKTDDKELVWTKICGVRDLNTRPPAWEADVLPVWTNSAPSEF